MIDPSTGSIETRAVPSARADLVAILTRYSLSTKVIVDRGKEFMAELKTMIEKDYGNNQTNHDT